MSARSLLLKRLPCVCCELLDVNQPNQSEAHHLNLDGHAGQKRRGDEFQVVLCAYHHRGTRPVGMTRAIMAELYGPSLADGSKEFHKVFPDDDQLLALTNAKLETLEPASA